MEQTNPVNTMELSDTNYEKMDEKNKYCLCCVGTTGGGFCCGVMASCCEVVTHCIHFGEAVGGCIFN